MSQVVNSYWNFLWMPEGVWQISEGVWQISEGVWQLSKLFTIILKKLSSSNQSLLKNMNGLIPWILNWKWKFRFIFYRIIAKKVLISKYLENKYCNWHQTFVNLKNYFPMKTRSISDTSRLFIAFGWTSCLFFSA